MLFTWEDLKWESCGMMLNNQLLTSVWEVLKSHVILTLHVRLVLFAFDLSFTPSVLALYLSIGWISTRIVSSVQMFHSLHL